MELLIVISIIATLAGLLLPAVGLVRRLVKDVQCSNNLRQLAIGLEVFRREHDENFPARMMDLNKPDYSIGSKLFLCPMDPLRGSDLNMGRPATIWGNVQMLHESGSSYCYETSSLAGLLTTDLVKYFWRDDPQSGNASWVSTAVTNNSWQDAKLHQVQSGNLQPGKSFSVASSATYTDFGAPFPSSSLPVIRCNWHFEWRTKVPSMTEEQQAATKKILNVALGFNVFWSSPYWEHDTNPGIPLR